MKLVVMDPPLQQCSLGCVSTLQLSLKTKRVSSERPVSTWPEVKGLSNDLRIDITHRSRRLRSRHDVSGSEEMIDLVKGLREGSWANAPWEPEYKIPPTELNLEAADRIEQLEAENQRYRMALEKIVSGENDWDSSWGIAKQALENNLRKALKEES